MREILETGKSTSKIISKFMKTHNLKLDDVRFEVIEEGSRGFLNLFGQKPTTIKFLLPNSSNKLQEFTENLLEKMDIKYSEININSRKDTYFISIKGVDNPGFLIGKEGKMLDSFQYILNQMINKFEKRKNTVKVDVDGYRKRKKTATNTAKKTSRKIQKSAR